MRIILLIAHLMVIAIGTGLSFANYANIRHAAAATGDGAAALARLRRTYGRIGDVIITLIWASGLGLVGLWLASGAQAPGGWFYAKLGFVVLLTVCHGLARLNSGRMARAGTPALLGRIELLVAGVWLSALASIGLAVLAFGP